MLRTVFSALAIAALLFSASCGGKAAGKAEKGDKAGKTEKAGQAAKGEQSKGGEAGSKAETVTNEGAETPEKAFDALKAAMEHKGYNISKALTVIVPEERPALGLYFHLVALDIANSGEDEKAAEKYKAVASRHKVGNKPDGMEDYQLSEAMESLPKLTQLAKRMMKGVDVASFLKDAEAFLNSFPSDEEGEKEQISGVTDVKVVGDKASGKFKEGENEKTAEFRKVSGRWFVSFSTMLN